MDRGFVRTVALSHRRPDELTQTVGIVTAEVFDACRFRFPSRRYQHRVESDRGLVEGRRLHVARRGFEGMISVQWYAKAQSYRHAREDGGFALRIAGQVRLQPIEVQTRPTLHAHTPMRLLGLGAAGSMCLAGVAVMQLIARHPSWIPALDVVGFALAVMAIGTAILIATRVLRGQWLNPGESRLRPATPADYAADFERWRALNLELTARSVQL